MVVAEVVVERTANFFFGSRGNTKTRCDYIVSPPDIDDKLLQRGPEGPRELGASGLFKIPGSV